MTREELKAHCERQIQQFERVEKIMPVTPNDWKRYEEHKLILELLEQESTLDKIRAEIMDFEEELFHRPNTDYSDYAAVRHCVEIIDKYRAESEG